MGDAASHGVETLTDALFCVFQRDALWGLHRRSSMMGFNVTWLTAHEESMVDETLLSVGRRSAEERIASMLILLFKRAGALEADAGAGGVAFSLTQQHIADGLGLSLGTPTSRCASSSGAACTASPTAGSICAT
jgi:CRP-like cAMP-binding protein